MSLYYSKQSKLKHNLTSKNSQQMSILLTALSHGINDGRLRLCLLYHTV